MSNPQEMCPCGKPLHYTDPTLQRIVEGIIEAKGALLTVTVGDRSWLVPRHYIALHGIKGRELPSLGFEEVTKKGAEPPLAVGALVEKCSSEPGRDGHPDGARARVAAVIPHPTEGAATVRFGTWGYFVEWEDLLGLPVLITGSRIRPL